jgi:aspartate 4-decarboxylase
MTYIFDSLKQNKIISPGDTIALGRPIFTPYIEIPDLNNYQLETVNIDADPANHWVFPDSELEKLLDPNIKAFFVANPSNPPSVRMSDGELAKIAAIVEKRPDLILLTDDVYGTFTDNFVSLFGVCPHNTILVYSYSKYFGACGWRLGVIALHEDNIIDRKIRELREADHKELDGRYGSISLEPRSIKWIDRMVADSRTVALNHTAGASTPQQVMMVLFSLFCLMDEEDSYKNAMKRVVRRRHRALYKAMGIEGVEDPNSSYYYTVLDLEILGEKIYGRDFVDWALKNTEPSESLFRVAEEAQVVLLPAAGFGTVHRSTRVSLANLNESDYVRIGECYRKVLDEYYETYKKQH